MTQEPIKPEFVIICGPTASGKTEVGIRLAREMSGEIICCDSVQLYRGFDIGSAKPSLDEQSQAPHHLFDVFAWHEPCDAAIYATRAKSVIAEIRSRGRIPIVVGGTGLYLRALLGDNWDDDVPSDETLRAKLAAKSSLELYEELARLDPRRASELHRNDRFRVARALEINLLTGLPVPKVTPADQSRRHYYLIKMEVPREELYRRINSRTSRMLELGLVEEVSKLLRHGVSPDCKPMNSIGYKETMAFLRGEIDQKQLENLIATATRQYSKRQMTWFRKLVADAVIAGSSDVPDLTQKLKVLI